MGTPGESPTPLQQAPLPEKPAYTLDDLRRIPEEIILGASKDYQRLLMEQKPDEAARTGFIHSLPLSPSLQAFYRQLEDGQDGSARFFVAQVIPGGEIGTTTPSIHMKSAGVVSFAKTMPEGMSGTRPMTEHEIDERARSSAVSMLDCPYSLIYDSQQVAMHYAASQDSPPKGIAKGDRVVETLTKGADGKLIRERRNGQNQFIETVPVTSESETIELFMKSTGISELAATTAQPS